MSQFFFYLDVFREGRGIHCLLSSAGGYLTAFAETSYLFPESTRRSWLRVLSGSESAREARKMKEKKGFFCENPRRFELDYTKISPVKASVSSLAALAAIGLGSAPLYGALIAPTDLGGAVDLTVTCPDSGGSPETAASFGAIGVVGDLIDINTFNSLGDTELGLFSASGDLLGSNDDTIGLLSQIVFEPTSEGTYYIASGNYNSFFSPGFGAQGPAGAPVTTTVNGVDASFVVGETGAFWTSFDVVPEPSSLSLVAVAGLALLRRRRS